MKKFTYSILFAALLLTSCTSTTNLALNTAEDTTQHLFLATENNSAIKLELFDVDSGTPSASYEVTLPDPRATSRFESGANDPVQYDPDSGTFIFATDGQSVMGDQCMNADGTCNGRLYSWKEGESAASLFWDSYGTISGFLIDSETGTIWVNVLSDIFRKDYDGKSAPVLIQSDLSDGSIISQYAFSVSGPIRLSDDGILSAYTAGGGSGGIGIAQLDPSADEPLIYTEFGSIGDGSYAYLSGLSPDQEHFVTFADSSRLFLYAMAPDSSPDVFDFDHAVNNYNLYWSGDSSSFLAQAKYGIVPYNLDGTPQDVVGVADESVVLWAPSTRYLLGAVNEQLVLHDLEQNTSLTLESDVPGWPWPLGALFY